MSGVERRRLFCAVLFHLAAALCVIWSLCVLIERSAEEVRSDKLGWPFWTKLVVVTIGLTGAIVFIYIQCKQYLSLCSRWRARNRYKPDEITHWLEVVQNNFFLFYFRILLIQNAPERNHANQPQSPLTHQHSRHSSNATLHRNNSSILVITAPLSNVNAFERSNLQNSSCDLQNNQQQQQSQIIANIENNCNNFELDDDGFSQISFKHHLRHDERNSSRGSLHNVYDNMSISTTNTSATTRNYNCSDADSNFLKIIPGLQEVQEAESDEKRRSQLNEKTRTSMFIENSDILNDQNYPKLYYRHSTFLLPTTAKTSRMIDEDLSDKQREKRRYSDTKLLNNLHFENEFLVKKASQDDVLGSPTKPEVPSFDQLEFSIQNILEMDVNEPKGEKPPEGDLPTIETGRKKHLSETRNVFKSLPNLEHS